jgi:hypothetical protein
MKYFGISTQLPLLLFAVAMMLLVAFVVRMLILRRRHRNTLNAIRTILARAASDNDS